MKSNPVQIRLFLKPFLMSELVMVTGLEMKLLPEILWHFVQIQVIKSSKQRFIEKLYLILIC